MVAIPSAVRQTWRFGEFFVDADSRLLLRNDEAVALGPKAFDLLLIFLQRRGEVLSKHFLLNAVWPDTFVDVNNLNQQVAALRKAVDDTRYGWIETVPRVGFRFRVEQKNARPSRWRTLQLITTAVVILLGLIRFVPHARPTGSLAILPLRATEAQDAYLGLAIAEALTDHLAGSKQLSVRSAAVIRRYAGRAIDPKAAGKELQADNVVTGTVSRTDDTLTATLRLIRVTDGKQIWWRQFTSKPDLIFSFPDEIFRSLANEIGVTPAAATPRYRPPAAAYDAYLKGNYAFSRRSQDDFIKAESLFRLAVAIDPNYAAAWAALSDALGFLGKNTEADLANARALELDDSLADAHANLALGRLLNHYDFVLSRREFERAVTLDPNNPRTHHWRAYYFVAVRDFDRALAEIETARRLDPASLIIQTDVGNILFREGRTSAAMVQLRRVIERDPTFAQAHHDLALTYMVAGRHDDAIREMLRAAELNEHFQHSVDLALVYAASGRTAEARRILQMPGEKDPALVSATYASLGDTKTALEWLDRVYPTGSAEIALINASPLLEPLRNEPRFMALARRMHP